MRVLLINTSERTGGAAVACSRLMEALKNNGIKAKMLVRDKQTDQISVVELPRTWKNLWRFLWERMVIWKANRFHRHNLFQMDVANVGTDVTSLPEFKQADVVHLHWVNQGLLSLGDLRRILDAGKPVVWTLHDMWPFTGICHYAGTCDRYREQCHHCPLLYGGGGRKDLSYRTFRKKQRLFRGRHVTFVACSRWLQSLAASGLLCKGQDVVHIPNAINTNLFRPADKRQACERAHLPKDKKLLLFGSVKLTDKRKGLDYFVEACGILAEKYPNLKNELGVVTFGLNSEGLDGRIPFPVYAMDYVRDEKKLVDIYNAVSLYVTPSLEDNLPNTIMEAMACGVPCVGFQVGGIPEMIDHLHNGYVAQYRSADDFANGIHWALAESEYPSLSAEAHRKVASHYSESAVAKRYIDLYNKVTGHHAR